MESTNAATLSTAARTSKHAPRRISRSTARPEAPLWAANAQLRAEWSSQTPLRCPRLREPRNTRRGASHVQLHALKHPCGQQMRNFVQDGKHKRRYAVHSRANLETRAAAHLTFNCTP